MNIQEKNKQENKKALKILVPITICAGLVGGVIGVLSTTQGAQGLAEKFESLLHEFLYLIGPWGVIASATVGIAGGLLMYKSATKQYEMCMPNSDDEEIEEDLFTEIDSKISKAIILISITMITSFMFFAIIVAYMDRYVETSLPLLAISFVAFTISMLGEGKIQQILVDFTKILYPQKNGSVYDIKFSEKWEDSCDELEKLLIYKAAYKAYKTTSMTCAIALVGMMLCSFFFHYGPLPSMLVGCIWLIHTGTYGLEALKLDNN
ncbi:MAG: DUF3169 family protein [Firmicutes bacterium]|nr:DUF3169 family protein [Bacillota bacterium]